MKKLSAWILKLLGWEIVGKLPDQVRQYIVVVAPHTSNWDFPLGLLVRAQQQKDVKFLAKKSLFRPPLGRLFRWMGGYPVDRSGNLGFVDAVVRLFAQQPDFIVCITPEGTRSPVDRLKTGFYHIAKKAGVPMVLIRFDYGPREVTISDPIPTAATFEETRQQLIDFFQGARGKHPENSWTAIR